MIQTSRRKRQEQLRSCDDDCYDSMMVVIMDVLMAVVMFNDGGEG